MNCIYCKVDLVKDERQPYLRSKICADIKCPANNGPFIMVFFGDGSYNIPLFINGKSYGIFCKNNGKASFAKLKENTLYWKTLINEEACLIYNQNNFENVFRKFCRNIRKLKIKLD